MWYYITLTHYQEKLTNILSKPPPKKKTHKHTAQAPTGFSPRKCTGQTAAPATPTPHPAHTPPTHRGKWLAFLTHSNSSPVAGGQSHVRGLVRGTVVWFYMWACVCVYIYIIWNDIILYTVLCSWPWVGGLAVNMCAYIHINIKMYFININMHHIYAYMGVCVCMCKSHIKWYYIISCHIMLHCPVLLMCC